LTIARAASGRAELPATAETLTEYVAHLADAGHAPATIEQAIAAIRTAHRTAGHRGQPDTEGARLVLRGHRRQRASAGHRARQATPVTIDTLRAMIEHCDPATAIGLRDRVALVLGVALMGRRSELVALDLADLTETPDGLEVLIRASKTDQDAHGAIIAIPHGQHADTTRCDWCARGVSASPSTATPPAGCCARSPATAGSGRACPPTPCPISCRPPPAVRSCRTPTPMGGDGVGGIGVSAVLVCQRPQKPGLVLDPDHIAHAEPGRERTGHPRWCGQLGNLAEQRQAPHCDRSGKEHSASEHVLILRGVGDRDLFSVGGTVAVAEPHELAGDAQPLSDAHQHVIGHDLATLEDLRNLGLRLPAEGCDLALGDPGVFEHLVEPGDVTLGQDPAHVLTAVQRGVDRWYVLLAAHRWSTGRYRSDLVGVPVTHVVTSSARCVRGTA